MISKNANSKQTSNTLYLMKANKSKLEEEKKSARPYNNSTHDKGSSRSISQYKRWNNSHHSKQSVNKNSNQQSTSSVKKLFLKKNYFNELGEEDSAINFRIEALLNVFKSQTERQEENSISKSIEDSSLLSAKDTAVTSSQKKNSLLRVRSRSHLRNNSSYVQHQREDSFSKFYNPRAFPLEDLGHNNKNRPTEERSIYMEIDDKFAQFQAMKHKMKNHSSLSPQEEKTCCLFEDLIGIFKKMVKRMNQENNKKDISNYEFFESTLTTVAKEYELQIDTLKKDLEKFAQMEAQINTMFQKIKSQQEVGVAASTMIQFLEKKAKYDVEEQFRNQKGLQKIQQYQELQSNCRKFDSKKLGQEEDPFEFSGPPHPLESISDNESQKKDRFEDTFVWKGQKEKGLNEILSYAHECKEKNNYGAGKIAMNNKPQMKIKLDNWKSIASKPPSSQNQHNYHKIMSQR